MTNGREVANDIHNNAQIATSVNELGNHATQHVACERWYIFRYKVLTKAIKDYFQKHPDEVYFPWRKERKVRDVPTDAVKRKVGRMPKVETSSKKIEYVEKPCIPGYIFVNASIDDAIAMGRDVGLNPWKKRESEGGNDANVDKSNRYNFITHTAMLQFMDIVSYFQDGIRTYDPSDIDPEENDLVEFISGTLAGRRGYIKSQERKEGGIVIVPISNDEDGENNDDSSSLNEESVRRNSFLHIGIEVTSDQYRIIRFANPVRNNDIIKRTNQKVKELLKDYADGKIINEAQQKRLRGYAIRYAGAEMTTDIQRANLTLLLYRIYTILEDAAKRQEIEQQIRNNIIPAFDKRIENESGKRKEKVITKRAKFIEEKEIIDTALRQRQSQ